MIIYRPHRETLEKSLKEAKEFETVEEMKHHIMNQYKDYADCMLKMEYNYIDVNTRDIPKYIFNPLFDFEDIVIGSETIDDQRCGWHDTRNVCIKRFGTENFMEKYGYPQCIGMCATDYDGKEKINA